jgi:hypothetical protein
MVSNASVYRLRRRAERVFLTARCIIQSQNAPTAPIQGPPVWTTLDTDVPCRAIQQEKPAQPEAMLLAGQEVIPEYYILELPHDQHIDVNFRAIVDGVTYSVTRIEAALTDKVFKQVVITRRRGQGT